MADLSMKTAHLLHEQMRAQIPEFEKTADRCATILAALKKKPETEALIALKSVSETLLMLCYINLDLMAAYRQHLSTDCSTHYEDRQAMMKINVVMSESYKRIYGFKSQIKDSFWVAKIKKVVDFIGKYEAVYQNIENDLIALGQDKVLDKSMRDLTVHYDSDPMKVYEMLSSMSADDVTTRCGKFLEVLGKVTAFVTLLLNTLDIESTSV